MTEIPQFEEEIDYFLISSSARSGGGFQLQIEAVEESGDRQVVRASCAEVLEFAIDSSLGAELELVDRHPLLWQHQHDSATAYFTGVPSNPLAAVGAVTEAHETAVNGWFTTAKYLNRSASLGDLLKSGSGMLARGPVPLLEAYKAALENYATEVQIIGRHGRLRRESRALVTGRSYVIGMGWDFQIEA